MSNKPDTKIQDETEGDPKGRGATVWEEFFAFTRGVDIPEDWMKDRPMNRTSEDRPPFRSSAVVRLLAAALCLLILLCCAFLLRPLIRARYLFSELETLQLGHSTFEDAQRLAEKIGAEPSGPCGRTWCEWVASVNNSELPRWWRGLGEAFDVSFGVKNSVVMRKNTGFGIGIIDTFSPSSVELTEQENWGRIPRPEPVAAGWQTSELYRYYQFVVYMTPKASAEDRRRYTSFNFNCFWKYKGCRDARDLLPTADPFPDDK
jgi:hypothetical protein